MKGFLFFFFSLFLPLFIRNLLYLCGFNHWRVSSTEMQADYCHRCRDISQAKSWLPACVVGFNISMTSVWKIVNLSSLHINSFFHSENVKRIREPQKKKKKKKEKNKRTSWATWSFTNLNKHEKHIVVCPIILGLVARDGIQVRSATFGKYSVLIFLIMSLPFRLGRHIAFSVCLSNSCPLYNLKTVQAVFTNLHININTTRQTI